MKGILNISEPMIKMTITVTVTLIKGVFKSFQMMIYINFIFKMSFKAANKLYLL